MTDIVPETMTCVEVRRPGPPEALVPTSRPTSRPGTGEVLIKVAAAGVNRPDIMQRQGDYAPPAGVTDIPGLEVAGIIVATGGGNTRWHEGDRVCALVAGGGYAEYCVAPAPQCLPVPDGLDWIAAAALPETFFTVWTNVFERADLQPGETILVHGGSSGIGTTAIQLAKCFGARVIATAGSDEKCDACRALGANWAVNYRDEDFVTAVLAFTDGIGVNVVLDMVGGDYIGRNIEALAIDGRLAQIAFLQGSTAEVDFGPVMRKRLTISGSTLRPRSVERKGEIAAALEDKVWPLIAAGGIAPVIHAAFPLTEAAAAHRLMESSSHIGKIMLET